MTDGGRRFDAAWFFHAFTRKITWADYADDYRLDKPFTPRVIAAVNEIIEDGTGWVHRNELYRVDAVGLDYPIVTSSRTAGMNVYAFDLKIAVEHENKKSDWTYELIKLMQLRCPLKVVIGYQYCDCRGEEEEQKLRAAADMLLALDSCRFAAAEREEILLILGNGYARSTGLSEYTSFGYRGYLFDFGVGAFVPLASC